jgi:hypothetical protein
MLGLAVVSVGLLAAFLIIGWLTNSLTLPAFLFPPSSDNKQFSLSIAVLPKDAVILLNDKPYDPQRIPLAGDYTIKVSHEGYLPVTEEIRVHPNQRNQIKIRLMPISSTVLIARDVNFPGWDQHGALYFLVIPENTIYKWSDNKSSPLLGLEKQTYQLLYMSSGKYVVALIGEGPEGGSFLQMLNLETRGVTDLEGTGFVSPGNDTDSETVWGFNYDTSSNTEKPIWSLPLNGNLELISLENPQWAKLGEQLVIDPANQWLAIESSKGIAVWEIATGKLMATFEHASTPVWMKAPWTGLAYIDMDQSLKFASSDQGWKSTVLQPNIQGPIAALPDSSEVIFTRFNPFEGGTSFWAVDTETKGVRLLAQARTESGKVTQISLSPNGKRIAFLNNKNMLFLVTMAP